jgi:acyl dehydratase
MNPIYRVQAYNTARESENKIHDDTVARRFGFTGGLVPGVDVYAYMVHPAVERWGRDWLERGTAEIRLAKPVYDGNEAAVTAEPGEDGGLGLRVESGGVLCATGAAGLQQEARPSSSLGDYRAATPPAPERRPPADERSLAEGSWLGMRPLALTPEFHAQYLQDVRETDPIYAREGIAHPGMILRTGNWALGHNVVLGPWMHVGSTVHNIALAHVGDEIGVRAKVRANYERKGHRFVELDALVVANGTRPVAHLLHVAIYRPRQVGA